MGAALWYSRCEAQLKLLVQVLKMFASGKNTVIVYYAANFGATILYIFISFHAYVIKRTPKEMAQWKPRVYSCLLWRLLFRFLISQAPSLLYIAWQLLNTVSDRAKIVLGLCNSTCWYCLLHTLVIYPSIKTFPFSLFISFAGCTIPLRAETRRRIPQEPLERGCDKNGCCCSARTSRRGQESRGRRCSDHSSWSKFFFL